MHNSEGADLSAIDLVMDNSGMRVDRFIAAQRPELSRARVQALIVEGAVTVDGRVVRPSEKPAFGALIRVDAPENKPSALVPEDLNLEILFEDPELVVLFKPAGLVVHPARGHGTSTLVHGLLHAVDDLSGIGGEERPGIVHRLDKGTSGVMVVAKNDLAHRALKAQFSDHTIERRYLALVLGGPDLVSGVIHTQLGRAPSDRLRFASVEDGGREAITRWRLRERLGPCALLECRLETGRTHQVRVHLSESGWPILGDPLYRARRNPPQAVAALLTDIDHQLLHAYRLDFDHPRTGKRLRFERQPPEDFQRVLEGLRELPQRDS